MSTILILLTGLFVVVGGILLLKLHAFVALILAALIVAALTAPQDIIRSQVVAKAIRIQLLDEHQQSVSTAASAKIPAGTNWVILPPRESSDLLPDPGPLTLRLTPVTMDSDQTTTNHFMVETADWQTAKSLLNSPTGVQIVSEGAFLSAQKVSQTTPIARTTQALGTACGKLALLIVAASFIGECLLKSGAADRIVQTTLQTLGERGAPAAFTVSGFLLAIPVFFDTVFLLLVPLGKSLYLKTGRNYLLYIMSIVVGATMAHSLVPPTPGPLLIAEAFEVSLSRMIVGGCVVGFIAAAAGLLFAVIMNRRYQLVPPESLSNADTAPTPDKAASVKKSSTSEIPADSREGSTNRKLPSLLESLLPVVVPVLLMTLETRFDRDTGQWNLGGIAVPESISGFVLSLCERNMALLVGALAAVVTFIRFRNPTRDEIGRTMGSAIAAAGTIILVTSSGSAFGEMMQQTSVAELLQQIPAASPLGIVVAAFVVTAVVRGAQGSATVAMMTAAGVFGGLVTSGAAGVDPLYVALAVGCGSKPFPWMNDSGFLVITRMSGMTEAQGLRFITPLLTIAGVAGLLVVIVGVVFFP